MTKAILQLEQIPKTISLPKELLGYVNEKIEKNGKGGRPHFLQELAKTVDPMDTTLDILELVWLKQRNMRTVAKKYGTTYDTLRRLVIGLEPCKEAVINYLTFTPRRKQFFNKKLESSDYETVQRYIKRAKRDHLVTWKGFLREAKKAWKAFGYKSPDRWTSYEVAEYLDTLKPSMRYRVLVAIRQVAPQIGEGGADELSVTAYSDLQGVRKKPLFTKETKMVIKALKKRKMTQHKTVFELHVTGGFREGSKRPSGICNMRWSHFKDNFSKVDDYESKAKGGIWWRDCPLTIIFPDLPDLLKQMWVDQGKPKDARIIDGVQTIKPPIRQTSYCVLMQIYKEIRKAVREEYKDKLPPKGNLDPRVFEEMTSIRPHDADKIHVNLLWEREIPLEVVAGEYLQKGEGNGLVGRGWLTLDVIKKHYLSLTQRSKRFKKLKRQLGKQTIQFE